MSTSKDIIFTTLALLLLFSACKKENTTPVVKTITIEEGDYIFGNVYGECGGDCRTLYLLNDFSIHADADLEPTTPYAETEFLLTALPQEKHDLAKPLLTIPASLLTTGKEIEIDQIADADYLLLIRTETENKTWIFDAIDETAPQEIKDYFDLLIEVIQQIR